MKSSTQEVLPAVGSAMGGGYYAGRIRIDDQVFALIVAPKAGGEHDFAELLPEAADVPGAASWSDGIVNTAALVDAGSDLAKWARDLRIGGFDDWYLPSLDELEIIYRNLKPTSDRNYVYNRSGLNLSAAEPTRPYTLNEPTQTQADAFKAGSAEALDDTWYWSSTKHASDSDSAWFQTFNYGRQNSSSVYDEGRARAVRRLPI